MKIEILGTGCAKCWRLERNVHEAVKKMGLKAEVAKVESVDEIIKRGIMMTPGLAINGKIVSTGRVLSVKEIIDLIQRSSK